MANSAEYTSEAAMVLALRNKDMNVVSTLIRKPTTLAAFGLFNPAKTNDVFGVGNPDMNTITMGLENDPLKVQESELEGAYEPLIKNIIQHDYKRMAWRDTVPTESVAGTTITVSSVTVDGNGAITAVAVTGGSGWSGSAPTLVAVPAVGSYGHGAVLIPTMSGGTVSAVTVQSGGVDYTSSAVIVFNAGYSEGEQYARPIFHPSKMKTMQYIYKNDVTSTIRLAQKQDKNENEALLDLTGDAIVAEIANQATQINADIINGTPANETDKMWTGQYGLLGAIDDGSTQAIYAGADRSLSDGSTYWWRSIVDTTAVTWGADDLVDNANLDKGLSERSGGVDLVLVHPKLLRKWKKQGVAQLANINTDDKLREMVQFGFKSEVLKYGNTYIIGEPLLPIKTVLALNTDSFLFRFYNGKKFAPTQLWDMEGQSGGKEAHRFFVETNWLFACVAPNLNAKYTNVS